MLVQELQAQHDSALSQADALISIAERQKRQLTRHEQQTVDAKLKEAGDLKPQIAAAKQPTALITPAEMRAKLGLSRQTHIQHSNGASGEPIVPKQLSRDYFQEFYSRLAGVGPLTAAMYEGSSTSGGYAIPVVVDDQIIPLAPQDSAIRSLATVIPTKSDIKVAQVTVRTAVAAKSETSGFSVATPTLGGFTLSAFFAGVQVPTSLELASDVPLFNTFVLEDVVSGFLEYEESLFLTGSGSGQPQGIVGNCGSGVTEEPDSGGNLISIQGTLDILGKLKATYHKNASWVMQRATSLIIRKAQASASPALFEPVFRRENGIDLLHGYPVEYSTQIATAARGATPILFGDFKKSYVIGDRGGPALFVKTVDQTLATSGLLNLLFYRRTDGRVRVAEAVQQYNVAAS